MHAPIVESHTRHPTIADILTCHSREISGQTLQGQSPQSMAVNLSMASHVDAPAAAVRAAQMTSPDIDFQNKTTNDLLHPVRAGAPHLVGQQEGKLNVGLGYNVNDEANLAAQGKAIGGPLDVDYVNDQFGEFLTRLSSLLPQVRERGRDRWSTFVLCHDPADWLSFSFFPFFPGRPSFFSLLLSHRAPCVLQHLRANPRRTRQFPTCLRSDCPFLRVLLPTTKRNTGCLAICTG